MKVRFSSISLRALAAVLPVLFVVILASAVFAQEEVPPPYGGLKNPFSWDDVSAQEAGRKIYQQSCVGCHGLKGDSLPQSNFSGADFRRNLEEKADYYFWVLSEGRLNKGMPPYKASLSDEKRWQLLTFLRSLSGAPAQAEKSPVPPPVSAEGGQLSLGVPARAAAGQDLALTAVLEDADGRPVSATMVKFFAKVSFFGNSLMEIGEAETDAQGKAVLTYTPRFSGDVQIVARYGGLETAAPLALEDASRPFYRVEVGIDLPAPGPEVLVGTRTALDLGEQNFAPATALRLPGGVLSWLLIVAATLALIWFTYSRVAYQMFRIPRASDIRDTNTRLVPTVAMLFVLAMGVLLLLMLLTGPHSHLHALP